MEKAAAAIVKSSTKFLSYGDILQAGSCQLCSSARGTSNVHFHVGKTNQLLSNSTAKHIERGDSPRRDPPPQSYKL